MEILGDLLIILFRIFPFLLKNSYLWCENQEAGRPILQIAAGPGNNSFCQVSGLKKGRLEKCLWDGKCSALIYKANIVCLCVGLGEGMDQLRSKHSACFVCPQFVFGGELWACGHRGKRGFQRNQRKPIQETWLQFHP